jgi:hypothetical protein
MKKSNSEKYSAMNDMVFSSLFLRLQYYHMLMVCSIDYWRRLGRDVRAVRILAAVAQEALKACCPAIKTR